MSRFLLALVSKANAAAATPTLALSRGLSSGGHGHHHQVEHTTKENFLEKDKEYVDMHKGKVFGDYGLPDALGYAVGRSRMEKLALLAGNDQFYENKLYKFFLNSKERPHLVPSHSHYRQVGCPCNETHTCYTFLHKDVNQRCYCGNHLRLVSYDEYFQDLRARITACYEAYHKLPEGKRAFDQLDVDHQTLIYNYPFVAKPIEEGQLERALPPKTWHELEESVGKLRSPLFNLH